MAELVERRSLLKVGRAVSGSDEYVELWIPDAPSNSELRVRTVHIGVGSAQQSLLLSVGSDSVNPPIHIFELN